MEDEIVETPEEQLAKQHRKEKKDMQGKLTNWQITNCFIRG